jgi:IS6 family transposase
MRSRQHPCLRPAPRSAFAGYRFPPEVITLAVRWYLRFGLSYRDVEELLAERGIEVDHVSIYRWVQRFAPEFAEAARARQHVLGDRWHVDETYLKVRGTWRYLFRAKAGWADASGSNGRHGVEPPLAWQSFQLMFAAVVERQA